MVASKNETYGVEVRCRNCEGSFTRKKKRGKPQMFCSVGCRQEWWKKELRQERKEMKEIFRNYKAGKLIVREEEDATP